jgi:polyisoprenoid-binding protein YceI
MIRSVLAAGAALSLALAAAPVTLAQDGYVHQGSQIQAGTYELDPGHGKITWSVKHLGFSTYVGQFTGTTATLKIDPKNPAASSLTASVDTTSLGTLNPALDKHLSSAKFPTATFKSTRITATGPTTANVQGDLTLHGVTKPVTLKATFNQAGIFPMNKQYRVGFDGEMVVKRSDFGITQYVPAVSDDVVLRLEAEFVPAK